MTLQQSIVKRWYLFVIPFLLLVVALPGSQIYPYYQTYFSSAEVTLVGQTAVVKFNLSPADQANLQKLSRNLGLTWDGKDLAISLGADAAKQLAKYLPLNIGLSVPTGQELTLAADVKNLTPGRPELVGRDEEFIPTGAVAIVHSAKLKDAYSLPGKDIFDYTAATGTLGIILAQNKLDLVYVADITDQPKLEERLNSLKNLTVSPGPGYSTEEGVAAGFTEGTFQDIKTYTLSQPGLPYQPTFGIVRGKLLAASTLASWEAAKASADQGNGAKADSRYTAAKSSLPAFAIGSFYVDFNKLASLSAQSLLTLVAPLGKLQLGAGEEPQFSFGKLSTVAASWFGLRDLGPSSRMIVKIKLHD